MSLIGKEVSEFKVEAFHKNQFVTITRDDIKGHWSVFIFYPADFTYVCPTELGDLAEHYESFQDVDCEIYSVSGDTHFVHKAWHDASDTVSKVQYPMLADPTKSLIRDFEVLIPETGLAHRGSFVVNPEGKIVAYEVHDGGIGRDAESLLRKVQAAQFVSKHSDQVCPAKWQPGSQTLKPSFDLVGKL